MSSNSRLPYALACNALIVLFEIIALILSLLHQGLSNFSFYTQDSNYLSMIISLLYCIFAIRQMRGSGHMPRWLHTLRYISVSILMVTFLVVVFVLMPMMGENSLTMLYSGSMLYQHTLCPTLAVVSFFVFEERHRLPGKSILQALIPTFLYAVVAIILNLFHVIDGPYPFLRVYAQPWYASVLWCVIILGIAALIAFVVRLLNNVFVTRS